MVEERIAIVEERSTVVEERSNVVEERNTVVEYTYRSTEVWGKITAWLMGGAKLSILTAYLGDRLT